MYNVSPCLIVMNSEGSEILLLLQISKLTCHSFMDAGRLHTETPGSEKDCLLLIVIVIARVVPFFFFCIVSPNPNSYVVT